MPMLNATLSALADALLAVSWLGFSGAAADTSLAAFSQGLELIQATIHAGIARSPALMIGLLALIVLPPLAIMGLIARALRPRRAKIVMPHRLDTFNAIDEPQSRQSMPRSRAILSVIPGDGDGAQDEELHPKPSQHVIEGSMIRIGRQDDNDICLPLATVHRYHALVHRTGQGRFEIVDLSGANGNGLKVNGRHVMKCLLADGDLVDVGEARLRFASLSSVEAQAA